MRVSYSQARYSGSAHQASDFPAKEGVEVAFAGRSNAGKSSAINAILGRKSLARTSKTPGRTQLINFFSLCPGRLLADLPGYGFAKVPQGVRRHWRHLVEAYFRQRAGLAGVIVVIDIRRGLGPADSELLSWVGAHGCAQHLLLTKADKVSRNVAAAALGKVRRELGIGASSAERPVSVQLFSATQKLGLDEARAVLDRWLGVESI